MTTKFFNNQNKTLFEKLSDIAAQGTAFDRFWAVAGYFRSTGYFKLRDELENIEEIKILVGINVDKIFTEHNQAELFHGNNQKSKQQYDQNMQEDIEQAQYKPEIERGIRQMQQDLKDGMLQIKIHPTRNLHAKFYLCLPENHNEHSDGWVIMGSSNISESGLGLTQAPRYELNVAMKDYDDVHYCYEEFEKLWQEGVEVTANDVSEILNKTYLTENLPTPYEIYLKVLIDYFGERVEDNFSLDLPDGVTDLVYQRDAVIQGYQMLMRHNGCFLADVVGLGKTLIATMIAKRFIEANGTQSKILVIYPPAVADNWKETFKTFGLFKCTQFLSNGSLNKIIDDKDDKIKYTAEEIDLVIVDEAHNFRSDNTGKYELLQNICKKPRVNQGWLNLARKKVMLLSATPFNNKPEDILNLIALFQDIRRSTIDGVPNLENIFNIAKVSYKELMKKRNHLLPKDITQQTDKIFQNIREQVVEPITIRRTRNNIQNNEDYAKDIKEQGIVFPEILPPKSLYYQMEPTLEELFYNTLSILLVDENDPTHLSYMRYRAVEYLLPEYNKKYKSAAQTAQQLANISKILLIKRLESSFSAFKCSLKTLLKRTQDMIRMYQEDTVIIAPDNFDVSTLIANDIEIDEIIEKICNKGHNENDFVFPQQAFRKDFINKLENDEKILKELKKQWDKIDIDPKYDLFLKHLHHEFFKKSQNPTGKLVIFSESVDTLNYLYDRLQADLNRTDIVLVMAKNRNTKKVIIRENFDANYSQEKQKDEIKILLTSDVLSEGINLHRANVIINYDTPWNVARLMQRIGRVNRIGSSAPKIYNYIFYPSYQGDKEIKLYNNALIKMQSFQSAFGEDAQIFSEAEVQKTFELFNSKVKDNVDKELSLMRQVKELYQNDKKLYQKIKKLPAKSRCFRRDAKRSQQSLVFIKNNSNTEFYQVDSNNRPEALNFLQAMEILEATPNEQGVNPKNDAFERHHTQVQIAQKQFTSQAIQNADTSSLQQQQKLSQPAARAMKFLRQITQFSEDDELKQVCMRLQEIIIQGRYNKLPKKINDFAKPYAQDKLKMRDDEYTIRQTLMKFAKEYATETQNQLSGSMSIDTEARIIISETFIE